MYYLSLAARPLRQVAVIGVVVAASACGGATRGEEGVPDGGLIHLGDTGATGQKQDTNPDNGDTGVTSPVDSGHDKDAPGTTTTDSGNGDVSIGKVDAGSDVSKGHESSALVAVPLSGCTPSEYNATLTIGGSQTFQFSVDTGSTTMGVASSQCSSCGVTPLYQPGSSASDQHMMGTAQYGSGAWSGEIYQDTVGIPSKDFAAVNFVAIDSQSQFFNPITCGTGAPQGIVGFGPSASELTDTTPFFDQIVAATGMPNVFATELCGTSGTLWLGGFDSSFTTAAPQYVPFANSVFSQYYYAVNLSSITVGGVTTAVANGQFTDSVVDTGTSIFILGADTFNGVSAAIAADAGFQQVFGGDDAGLSFLSSNQNCVSLGLTKAQLDATLPPMTLTFGSTKVQAAATESYLINYDGQWCTSIAGITQGANSFPFASIMGSPVLRSNVVIFDRANQQIGFAPHTACPG